MSCTWDCLKVIKLFENRFLCHLQILCPLLVFQLVFVEFENVTMTGMETSGCTCVYFLKFVFYVLFCSLGTISVLSTKTHFVSLWFPTIVTVSVCGTKHGLEVGNFIIWREMICFPVLKPILGDFSRKKIYHCTIFV